MAPVVLFMTWAAAAAPIQAQTEGAFGMSAPPEAYEDGNPLPYFGSENPWNRRMFGERPADLFDKRRGQRQILAIIGGEPEQAVAWARMRLAADPADHESWFNLIVALGQLGRDAEMITALNQALAAGLPFERLVAGPRDLLAPLYEDPEYQRLEQALDVRLVHGPMLGDLTSTGTKVWVRTAHASSVTAVAVPLDRTGNPVGVEFTTSEAEDFSGVGQWSGLQPDTTYRYRLTVDGQPVGFPGTATFRTAPREGRSGRFAVAYGGCAGFTPRFERIWDQVGTHKPNALLLLGDNVYLDIPETPGAFHQYTYFRRQSRPEFRRLTSVVPTYAIWDDHDAGMDDVWLGPYIDRPEWKIPNLEFFKRNWNNPESGSPETPGLWFRFMLGDIEFILLDGRNYRTNPFAEERTMLGPVQKAWLLETLADSSATFKVVASPVAWTDQSKPGSYDTWSRFQEERDEIFDFVRERKIAGVILLSSDRHRSDAWKITREGAYDFYEFASGKLTNVHTHDTMPGALFSSNENGYGLLRFDTTRDDPTVTNEFWNIHGEKVWSLTVPLSELTD